MQQALLSLALIALVPGSVLLAEHPIAFKVQVLTVDSNEGCAIADFDADGKPDISAGRNWYRNGDWLPRPLRMVEDRDGYVRSNGEWAHDVNGDGRPDIISMDFVQESVFWYENPGADGLGKGLQWTPHHLANTGLLTNETSYLVDLNGDEKPEWISDQWNKTNPLIAWSFITEKRKLESANKKATQVTEIEMPTLQNHLIGNSTGHGIGFGDLNNDGRRDILVGTGWYEAPEGDVLAQRWKYHADWEIQGACPMIVHDVNGDGMNDVLASNAHNYGITLWLGQGANTDGKLQFTQQLIDDSFSQAHCLHLADLDGDQRPELITGKRVRAHNGRDPGGTDPPVVKYYVWKQNSQRYEPHVIQQGSVGIGLQIRTADLDADGDLEIIVAGKEGTQILWNQRVN